MEENPDLTAKIASVTRLVKKLLIINNIPTPYRTFMFTRFHELGPKFGFDVSVAFQARREERRAWNPDEMDMRFPFSISSGIGFGDEAQEFFTYKTINSDVVRMVSSGEYDFVLMAAFMSVTNWITSLAPAGRTIKVLWSESNMLSTRYMNGPAKVFKKMLLRGYDINALPGERALEYLRAIDPDAATKPIVWLPNIVDSSLFVERTAAFRKQRSEIRRELDVADDEVLIFGIGMMFEKKGFDLAIEAARNIDGKYRMIFLGDGPQREAWQKNIMAYGLSDRIRLPGQAAPEVVARHFAAADWFFHPARFDPSPLVVIEAANAGMPLAISRQTGNSPEAIDDGRSGVLLDASGVSQMAAGIRKMLNVSDDERRAMGENAARVAREKFEPDAVIERFFNGLLEFEKQRAEGAVA